MSATTTAEPATATVPKPEPRSGSRVPWRAIFLGLLAVLFLTPLLWMVTTSLKSTAEVSQADLTFLPENPSTEGYSKILGTPQTPVGQGQRAPEHHDDAAEPDQQHQRLVVEPHRNRAIRANIPKREIELGRAPCQEGGLGSRHLAMGERPFRRLK